ncbi:MAG: tetratricopeptide repeat protein [Planctomycetota bacterium]|jgi:hypothetical protein
MQLSSRPATRGEARTGSIVFYAVIGIAVVVYGAYQATKGRASAKWEESFQKGTSLKDQARFAEAEAELNAALTHAEAVGTESIEAGRTLNALGALMQARNREADAEAYFRKAAPIIEE